MRKFTLSAIISPILITLSHAAEVWAPGVSWEGGWYDFNKYAKGGNSNGTSGYLKDDSLMCWAVSAANVIAWWQEQNSIKSEYDYSTIPQGKDVHQTFVAVFNNLLNQLKNLQLRRCMKQFAKMLVIFALSQWDRIQTLECLLKNIQMLLIW